MVGCPSYFQHLLGCTCYDRFAEVHEFAKPLDGKALDLMKSCATAVMEKFGDISFSYGFSDEFRYLLFLVYLFQSKLFLLNFLIVCY